MAWTSESAKAAAKKGWESRLMNHGPYFVHAQLVEAGRKGGLARAAKMRAANPEKYAIKPTVEELQQEIELLRMGVRRLSDLLDRERGLTPRR